MEYKERVVFDGSEESVDKILEILKDVYGNCYVLFYEDRSRVNIHPTDTKRGYFTLKKGMAVYKDDKGYTGIEGHCPTCGRYINN